MCVIVNIFTTVGGEGLLRYSNKLFCLLYKKWLDIFPPMRVRRLNPRVVYAKTNIVVLGGDNTDNSEVEIMNTGALQ